MILGEVLVCCESASNGQHPQLALSDPFWTYVNWVRQQDFAAAERFWSRSLRDLTEQASRAETYPRGDFANQAQGSDEEWLELPAETLAALRELADRCQIGFETLMQGAWVLLLNRESGGEDIVYGLLKAERPAGLGSNGTMLGPLSNTLPVRVQVPPGLPLVFWLKSLQSQLTELGSYHFCNPDQIREWAALPQQLPLFQCVVIRDEEMLDGSLEVPGSSLKIQSIESVGLASIPLAVVLPRATVSRLRVSYDQQFIARETVQRMLAHFQALLEGVIENPNQPILNLPIMSRAEAEELFQWNQTDTAYPRDKCIHELFEQQAGERPEAIAAVFEDEQLTYGELNARANQLAHHLQMLGVQPESRIALCVERSLDMLVSILGILKAGGAYVPLAPAYPLERLSLMLEDFRPPVVLNDHGAGEMPAIGVRRFVLTQTGR